MRKLDREPLSEDALGRLCQRTMQVAASALGLTTIGARSRARRAEAKRLWDQERTVAFDEIVEKLRRMAPGNERCMYCESNEARDIDHFWPKKMYPGRAYTWENYLWACPICNSNYKRDQFPTDERGRPLLINPLSEAEDPRDHLELTPKTGKYVELTLKGKHSIRVFGLGRGPLERSRAGAWHSVQAHIIAYAVSCREEDYVAALEMQRTLCLHPHASIFGALLRLLDTPGGASLIRPACVAAIQAHPEVRSWV